jgi:acylglycerol lipase
MHQDIESLLGMCN